MAYKRTYGTPESPLLKKIKKKGFNPIGITIMICEETFIFKTDKERNEAADIFMPEGFWQCIETGDWEVAKNMYKENHGREPKVYWLK